MPGSSTTTKSVRFSSTTSSSPSPTRRSVSPERMCFRADPVRHNGNYYYREEYHEPTRRHQHHHHTHAHYSRSSRSSVPVYVTHSPRVSTSSYRVASASSPVMYETRTSTTRYRN